VPLTKESEAARDVTDACALELLDVDEGVVALFCVGSNDLDKGMAPCPRWFPARRLRVHEYCCLALGPPPPLPLPPSK